MRGLILQLARLDSEAEAQVRIVDFFDSLLRAHATLDHILRSTAGLTAVPTGVTMETTGEVIGFDAQGRRLDALPAEGPSERRLVVANGTTVAHVWMCDPSGPDKVRDLVMERLVLTCEVLWGTDALGSQGRALERLLTPTTARAERQRIAGLFRGLCPPVIRSLYVRPRNEAPTRDWCTETETALSRALDLGRQQLLSVRTEDCLRLIIPAARHERLSVQPRALIGIGPEVGLADAAVSAQLARAALLFTPATSRNGGLSRYDQIGAVCLLQVDTNPLLLSDPLVGAVVSTLRDDPSSEPILRALAEHDSIRAAAKHLHLHHSSVSSRVDRLEKLIGHSLRGPSSSFALRLALAHWHFLTEDSSATSPEPTSPQ